MEWKVYLVSIRQRLASDESYATMRQLSLHASALNDAEYELYTSSLQDVAWAEDQGSSSDSTSSSHDDAYYESMRVSVREVRAWIRGRYAHVPPTSIDGVSDYLYVHLRPWFDHLIRLYRFYGCFRRVWTSPRRFLAHSSLRCLGLSCISSLG